MFVEEADMNTAEQDDVVSNIKTNLTCQSCYKLFLDPRILPCLHTFCCQCIESLVRNRPMQDKILKCPTCQLETGLDSRSAVRKLPANSLLVSLLDLLLIQQGEAIGCDICDDSEEASAHVRCKECSVYLCKLHEEAHKRARDTKQHVLLSLDQLKSMSLRELNRPTYCSAHTDEKLALFCDTCNVSICRNCALGEHKQHNTQFLEDAYSKLRPRLSELLDQTKSVCIKVENAIPMLDWMLARVNLKADGVLRDIEESISAKIKALEQRRKELRSTVELIRINRKTILEMQKKKLEASRDTLRVSCHFVKRVLEEGDSIYLLSAKDLMSDRLKSLATQHYGLQPREDHAMRFHADGQTLHNIIDSFGSIEASYAHYATSSAEGRGLQEAVVNQLAHFTVVTRDRKGKPIACENGDVNVQIQAPDDTIIVGDVIAQNAGRHSVTYSPSLPGLHLIQVTIRGFPVNESPFAVHVPCEAREYKDIREPTLVIGSSGEKPGQLKGARGIAVDKENRIIVCDRNNFRVQVFDSSGVFLFSFGKKGDGKGEFQGGPLSVAVNKDGKIYVCDSSRSSVLMFDSKGEYLGVLKPPEGVSQPAGRLNHVVVDAEGRVYVDDCENRVIYLCSSSAEYLSHFKVGTLDDDDGLQRKISGIAVNSKGEIVVSMAKDAGFKVFKRDGSMVRNIALPFTELNLLTPEAIAVDSNDNILLVDSMKNSLLVFSAEDGHLIAECAREGLCNPYGVAVDLMGRILIADASNQIKVF